MKVALRGMLALTLAVLPALPRLLDPESAWPVEAALIVLLAAGLPEHRASAWSLTSLWVWLLSYEGAMWGSRLSTGEDMVLYDALQLVWNLGLLFVDLRGAPWVAGVVLTGVAAVVVAILAGRWAFGVLLDGPRAPAATVGALALVCTLAYAPMSSSVLFAKRSWASVELMQRVRSFSRSDVHLPHEAIELDRRPDVRIYILESYGMAAFHHEAAGPVWESVVAERASALEEAGWHLAATRSRAPTHGGRSWICDAAVLTGRQLRYQAEYQALTGQADTLRHLPGWFADHGYRTLLSRPSDRARPGIELQNRFGFEETVFFDDFAYRGKPIGWGKIPDQYSVGWLEENRFAERSRPLFTFVHLSTSHFPWRRTRAPYLDDWRDFDTREKTFEPLAGRDENKNLMKFAKTFGRGLNGSGKQRRASDGEALAYLRTLDHGLRAIVDTVRSIPSDRPTIVLIMGDHQPAFVSRRRHYDVPLHLVANDPRLLEEWLDGPAIEGWTPPASGVWHASLYSRIVRTLARYDGDPPPPLLDVGIPL